MLISLTDVSICKSLVHKRLGGKVRYVPSPANSWPFIGISDANLKCSRLYFDLLGTGNCLHFWNLSCLLYPPEIWPETSSADESRLRRSH